MLILVLFVLQIQLLYVLLVFAAHLHHRVLAAIVVLHRLKLSPSKGRRETANLCRCICNYVYGLCSHKGKIIIISMYKFVTWVLYFYRGKLCSIEFFMSNSWPIKDIDYCILLKELTPLIQDGKANSRINKQMD